MNTGNRFEELVEAYVAGDLPDKDRAFLNSQLEVPGEVGESARESLAFEQTLRRTLTVEPFEDDVADVVLTRARRRATHQLRRPFEDGSASRAVAVAVENGRVRTIPHRRTFHRVAVTRVAAAVLFLFGLYVLFFAEDLFLRDDQASSAKEETFAQAPTKTSVPRRPSVGDVYYTAAGSRPTARRKKQRRDRVFLGDAVETGGAQIAVLRLGNGARLEVQPNSRVVVMRGPAVGRQSIRLIRGSMRFRVDKAAGAVPVVATDCRGTMSGRGEIRLVSGPLTGARSIAGPEIDHAVMVRMDDDGRAEFHNRTSVLTLRGGELGIVGPMSAVKMASPKDVDLPAVTSVRNFGRSLSDPNGLALEIDKNRFSRQDIATEALRVYGAEVLEIIVRSLVIDAEMRRLGITVPASLADDARRYAETDELIQVAPLRSKAARNRRIAQVAGLLAITRHAANGRGFRVNLATIGAVCSQTWSRLARHLNVRRNDKKPEIAFDVVFRRARATVSHGQLWDELRGSLRASEMRDLMERFGEREVVRRWLRGRGEAFPEINELPGIANDDAIRYAQRMVARLNGLTMVRVFDRTAIRQVFLAHTPEPTPAEIQTYVETHPPTRRQVSFEHYFVPFTEATRGLSFLGLDVAVGRARQDAENLADLLRRGDRIEPRHDGVGRPRFLRSGVQTGPRPWWKEAFGEELTAAILDLPVGKTSDPIRGDEGFHVVKVIEAIAHESVQGYHPSVARNWLKLENAHRRLEKMIKHVEIQHVPVEELLQ